MKSEEFRGYQLLLNLAEEIWTLVIKWDYFSKDTIGKQLVRSADSVSADLREGFGRYFYKEEKQFSYYLRNSLYETKTCLPKVSNRKLISSKDFEKFGKEIIDLGVKLNS